MPPKDQRISGCLENKAQRLKVLTEDVVEASKASTGNISLEMTELNFIELVNQVIGEFEEKFEEKNLKMVVHFDEEEAIICADGRRLWRVLENVFWKRSKVCNGKYKSLCRRKNEPSKGTALTQKHLCTAAQYLSR